MQLIDSRHPSSSPRRSRAGLAWWAPVLMLMALLAVPAFAQYRASLDGVVVDAQNARIPGATLLLTDKETNRAITAKSDGEGNFAFHELAPSHYTLLVTRDGFKKKSFDNLSIIAEQANGLTVTLEVGGAAETVTVNAAETPVMDVATGSISGTIDQNEMAKMPDFGRDPMQLAQLAPGMFGDGSQQGGGGSFSLPGNQGDSAPGATSGLFATENKPQVFGNGQRNDTNGITLDGVSIASVTWGSAAVVTPNPDAIKEMKVVSNGYDAEYGRYSGAQVQMISQNGTNQYHGTALFKFDRPGMNAYQRWSPNGKGGETRDDARYNEYGGTIGGPILHNRIFAFFSYDTIRNTGTTTGQGWYETPFIEGASNSNSIANKFLTLKGAGVSRGTVLEAPGDNHDCKNINLVQGVNCNYIQGKGLDLGRPLTSGLGKHDPSYADPTGAGVYTPGLGGDGTGNYNTNMDGNADIAYMSTKGPNNNTNVQYGGRLDFQVTQKDLIAGSVYYVPVDTTSFNGPNGAYRDYNLFHHDALNYSTGLLWNHTFSDTLLNEARADMAGWRWNELKDNPQSPLGLPDDFLERANWAGNSFSSAGMAGFGPNIGSMFDQWTLNFKDVATKVHKSHNLKFGGQVTRLAYKDAPTWDAEPSYSFNNMWDFLNDAPNGEFVTADPRTGQPSYFRKDDRQNLVSFFAQDDWRVRPNLTFNIGLRWDYFGGMTEKNGHEPNVRLGAGANTLTDLRIVLGGKQVNADKGDFGPVFGFAWSPAKMADKLVIRGGAGLSFNGLEEAITTNTRNNPPYLANGGWVTGDNIVYGVGSDLYQAGGLPANKNLITKFNDANLPVNGLPTSITAVDQHLHTSYVYHYSVEAQYTFAHDWLATVGYQGALGRHLPLQTNLNNYYASKILSGAMNFNPIVNGIDWYYDGGNSENNSLLLEARHPFSHTFEADVQYRIGKSTDDGSGPYTSSLYEWLPGYNHGASDFDSRQMFKAFGVWSPVLFKGQHSWMEKIAGGWTMSPIFNFHSGFPFTPTYGNGIGCNAFYSGSCGNGGNGGLLPSAFAGGAGSSQSTEDFKTPKNFSKGGSAYFTQPVVPQGNSWNTAVAPKPVDLPTVPGIERNHFYGPRYTDLDFSMTKAFGLPNIKYLGDNARFELRANAFNLFNKLNLANVDSTITDSTFGRANTVLGSRTVEAEVHFKF